MNQNEENKTEVKIVSETTPNTISPIPPAQIAEPPVAEISPEPQAPISAEQITTIRPEPSISIPDSTATPSSYTVLLVEDDPFLSSLLKAKLQKAGITVNLATDGEQAVEILQSFYPNLILLDLILPKKSGFEVLESIQSNPQISGIPVIILSNLGQDSDVSKGKDLGAIEYFIKAKTSIDELVKKIEDFLKNKKQTI